MIISDHSEIEVIIIMSTEEEPNANIPQLHSFQTSQPINEEPVSQEPAIQEEEEEDSIVEEPATETEPKSKSRKASATKDLNVIDIDDEDEDSSGTSVLPLSKIKKIFKTDPEHVSASEAAVFSTAIATELFIQYFTEQASLIARSEKRKKLQYKDFASAVGNIEQLYFLSDTVPKTVNLKNLVEQNKVNYSAKAQNQQPQALAKGQQTLNLGKSTANKNDDEEDLPESDPEEINDNDDDDEQPNTNAEDADENNNTEDDEGTATAEASSHSLDQDKDVIMTE